MSDLFISPFTRHDNSNGAPMSGCKIFFYESGTLTPAPIYTTEDLDTEHTNPVVSDAGGLFAPIYLDPAISYRAVLKTSANVTVQDIDPYNVVGTGYTYLVHFSFLGTPDALVIMDGHVVGEAFSIEADFDAGAWAKVSTNPASTWTATLHKNNTEIGTLEISTGGVATFQGDATDFDEGDLFKIVSPNSSTTLVDLFVTIKGATS